MAFRGLFVGVDRYQSHDIRDLSCAARDATALEALFADTLGGPTVLLTDHDATLSRIEAELEALSQCDADDTVVIAFSGHGSETHELIAHDNAENGLHHVEFQTDNDDTMHWRMLNYYMHIVGRHGDRTLPSPIPVKQTVLYIGPDELGMHENLHGRDLRFRYEAKNIKSFAKHAEDLGNSANIEDQILGVLCRERADHRHWIAVAKNIRSLPKDAAAEQLSLLLVAVLLRPIDARTKLELEKMASVINVSPTSEGWQLHSRPFTPSQRRPWRIRVTSSRLAMSGSRIVLQRGRTPRNSRPYSRRAGMNSSPSNMKYDGLRCLDRKDCVIGGIGFATIPRRWGISL